MNAEAIRRGVSTAAIVAVAMALLLLVYKISLLVDAARDATVSAGKMIVPLAGQLTVALGSIQAIETNTTRTEAEMAGLLNQSRHAMLTEAEKEKLLSQENALAGDMGHLIIDADSSVQKLGSAAESLESIAPSATVAIDDAARDTHQLLSAGTDSIEAIHSEIVSLQNSSLIRDTLAHTAGASANLDATSANLAATTADLKKIADQWAAPVKGFWNHFRIFLGQIAGPAASVATAVK